MNRTEARARCSERIALREGVVALPERAGARRLVTGAQAESFLVETRVERDLMKALADGFVCERTVVADAARQASDGEDRSRQLLEQLRAGGWLRHCRYLDGVAQYVLAPVARPSGDRAAVSEPVLSRFALLRRTADHMLLESPRSWCNIQLVSAESVAIVSGAGTAAPMPDVSDDLRDALIADLSWAGLLVERTTEEAADLAASQWGTHELWFHERSRDGPRANTDFGFGGTDWARDRFSPLPARREPPFRGEATALPTPDLDAVSRSDPSLTTALENRTSRRQHDDADPITIAELGDLLYRSVRTRAITDYDGVQYKNRPHPSGGSVYELEIYPLVRHVAGLSPGLYHYDAEDHRLVHVVHRSPATDRLLRRARMSLQQDQDHVPQVVLLIAARFGRVMWRYEGMAYALMLKHVGVVYQTLYLVAHAMDLAACGIGGGNSTLFAEATGLDPMTESSVGEFALGRPLRSSTVGGRA